MKNISTLTSLAMLKVNSDVENQDYIEYLRPFVLYVLGKNQDEPVTDSLVAELILNEFGLNIPNRAINLCLRRLVKKSVLKKEMGVFLAISSFPEYNLEAQKAEAKRHIQAVVTNLIEYSKNTPFIFESEDFAIKSMLSFLSDFSIDCLRTYVFGTALPEIPIRNNKAIIVISKFVQEISQKNLPLFDSFMVIVKGQMLANALLCPDLDSQRLAFKKVEFYLDTPLVIRLLGLEGTERKSATLETTELVESLGGKFRIFEHTYLELYNVIKGAAEYIDHPEGRGSIVIESRRVGRKRSDLLLISERLDGILHSHSIIKSKTPPYKYNLQIDETAFENILNDEIHYYNEKAILYDVNSVRSIYVLRHGKAPVRLEDANSVMVTSNASFAKAAYKYGRNFEETREVSSVITDFSLANISWLKRPLKAPQLPQREVIAYSYAALNPRQELWAKYLAEIDKLEKKKDISSNDHAILRYSLRAREELMELTLGDEEALNSKTVSEILERATSEWQEQNLAVLYSEQESHERTKKELESQIHKQVQIEKNIARVSHIIGLTLGVMISIFFLLVIVYGVLLSLFGIGGTGGLLISCALIIFVIISILNLWFGMTVKNIFIYTTQRIEFLVNNIISKIIVGNLSGEN